MSSHELAQLRMRSQYLWGAPLDTPEQVVGWLAALQSQEFAVAKWSVAQRANGVSENALDRAYAVGAILRTHLLRPTWHFVLPADIRWLLDLTAPRVHALNAYYYRKFELDDELFARSSALIAAAVDGGRQRTRKELAAILQSDGITASGLRLGYLLMRAELDAVICSGALSGKQHTYAAFDERVPQGRSRERDEALAELTGRYFASRGPATLKDFGRWSGLTAADARSGLDAVKSQLEHDVVDGRTYWFAASAPWTAASSPVIDLVQGYDEIVMSYSESKDVLAPPPTADGIDNDVTVLLHAILLNGQLIGHWKPVPKTKSVVLETSFYRPLEGLELEALDVAVERFSRFKGVRATVVHHVSDRHA